MFLFALGREEAGVGNQQDCPEVRGSFYSPALPSTSRAVREAARAESLLTVKAPFWDIAASRHFSRSVEMSILALIICSTAAISPVYINPPAPPYLRAAGADPTPEKLPIDE